MSYQEPRMTNEQLLETFTRDEVKAQFLNLYMYETTAKWTDRLKALQSYKDMLDEDANNPFADNLTLARRVELLRKLIPIDDLLVLINSMPSNDREKIKSSIK